MKVQVGECPDCGYIVKEEPDFPGTPTCTCGTELVRATLASEAEVREAQK